jgi:hypothetical protein
LQQFARRPQDELFVVRPQFTAPSPAPDQYQGW